MGKRATIVMSMAVVITVVISCQKETNGPPILTEALILPEQPYDYSSYEFPEHFNSEFLALVGFNPGNNPITDAGATLGRVIFYDKKLSANKTISCASCHHQENGFADPSPFSEGFEGGHTSRNSMHLVNLQFNRRMFWDTRANNLETQVLLPIQDAIEMGMELDDVVARLEGTDYYPNLFDDAFGTPEITSDRISKALAQFVRSIVSYQTKWDDAHSNDFADFTESELIGKDIFFSNETKCNQCHMTNNFYITSPMNNGLDVEYADGGQFNVTGDLEDHGQFKVPSLRNTAVSAPYMHDGRFETLEEVVEHYNSGLQAHPFLDDRLTEDNLIGGIPRQMNLSDAQKQGLVDFMKTLTDHEMLNDPKYSNPFVHIVE
jgi:cytochrome c peroxidase